MNTVWSSCPVPSNEEASTTTAILQITFPDWCRNESGSSEIYLSMFTSFYFDGTLAMEQLSSAK